MRERTIETRLVNEVKKRGGLALKWTCPGHAGVPDRIIILPDGKTVYVELKAPGKKMRPLQEHWARVLTKMGHAHYLIDSPVGVDAFIEEVMPNEVHSA